VSRRKPQTYATTKAEAKAQEDARFLTLEQRKEDISRVMDTPAGKRVIKWLFAETRPLQDNFNGNSRDGYEKGKRHMGLMLLDMVRKACPGLTLGELFDQEGDA